MRYNDIGEAVHTLLPYLKDCSSSDDLISALEYLFDELEIGYDELPKQLHEIFEHKKNEHAAFNYAADIFNDNNDL